MKQKTLHPTSHPSKKENVPIAHKPGDPSVYEDRFRWNDAEEERQIELRIVALRDDQIIALSFLVEVVFDKKDLPEIIQEIRTVQEGSGYVGIIMDEADSKENLLWWINFFEEHNKNTDDRAVQ